MKASIEGGGTVTQRFGPPAPTVASLEPHMYAIGSRQAWWVSFPGSVYYAHYHPGIDRAAVLNSDVQAMEDGTVIFAGYKNSIDGNQVAVRINQLTIYTVNHLSSVLCRVGQHVRKGQVIAHVGMTGAATGPHTHEGLQIGSMLYDSSLFLPGGPMENDPRVQPEGRDKFHVDGGGVNIWFAPPHFNGPGDIFATSRVKGEDGWVRDSGIYRRKDHEKIAGIGYGFKFLNHRDTSIGPMLIGLYRSRKVAVLRSQAHW